MLLPLPGLLGLHLPPQAVVPRGEGLGLVQLLGGEDHGLQLLPQAVVLHGEGIGLVQLPGGD